MKVRGLSRPKFLSELEVIYRKVKQQTTISGHNNPIDLLSCPGFTYTVISKQIFGSNWYAHYKFYCEFEKTWVEEELNLTLKDKIPLSLCFLASLAIIFTIAVIWKTP